MDLRHVEIFADYYDSDTVFFTYGNAAVVDLAQNLIKSGQRAGMEIVFFALDEEAYEKMSKRCIAVKCYDNVSPEFYEFRAEGFNMITWPYLLIGNEFLKRGKSYVYMDVDIVIRRHFDFRFGGYDCLIQSNGKNCCAGFVAMTPTENTVNLFTQEFLDEHDYLSYEHDQEFINKVVYKKLLKIKLLDRDEFPNGEYYYHKYKDIGDICKIVHFNYIKGHDNKVNKIKEYGMWI